MAPHFYIRDYLSDDSKIFVRRLTVYFEGKTGKGITINMWSEDPFKGEEGWVEIRIIRQQWDRLSLPAAVLLTFFPTKHSSNRLFLQPLSLSTRKGVTWFFFFFFPFFFPPTDIRPVASFCTQLEGISMVPLQVGRAVEEWKCVTRIFRFSRRRLVLRRFDVTPIPISAAHSLRANSPSNRDPNASHPICPRSSIDRSIGWKTGEIKRGGWRAMGQLRSDCFVESELASFRFDWKFYQLEKIALTDLSSRVIIDNFDKRDTAVYNPPDLDFLHSPFHGLLLTTLRPAIIYINNRCKLLMMGEKSKVEN